jgi:hypothetical protein
MCPAPRKSTTESAKAARVASAPYSDGIPLVEVNASDLTLTYTRAQPSAVTYSVQTTTDLTTPASWTATGVTQGTPDANGLTTASIPLDGPRFLRLQVTLNP